MLKKENRLKNFRLTSPRQIKSKSFNLKFGKNPKDINRFAFVVSKKLDKRATVRNKLKRKIRSIIEERFDNISLGHDFIFYPKKEAIDVSKDELSQAIKEVFSRNDLLNNETIEQSNNEKYV